MKKNIKKTHRSLISVLTLSFSILSLSAVIFLGSIQLFFNIRTRQEAIKNNQQLIAQEAAKTVSNFITEKISVLKASTWLTTPYTYDSVKQKELLQSLLGLYPSFLQARLFDDQNKLMMRVSRRSYIASERAGVLYIEDALDAIQHKDFYISPVYIDMMTNEPLILLAVSVIDMAGGSHGTLMAEMNLKFMWDLLYNIKHGVAGYAYVVDKHGNLISCNDESRVLRNENVRHIDPVLDFIQNSDMTRPVNVYTFRGLNQSFVVGSYVPLGTPEWAIVIELPWIEAYKNIIREIIIGIGAIILLAVLIGNLSVRLSKQISIPIVGLMETATKIAQGERKLLAKVQGPHEIRSLAETFNSMTAQLNRSYHQLEQKTEELDLYFTRSLDLLCITDMDGKFKRLNKEWEATLGYSINELLTRDCLYYVHPEDVPATKAKLLQLGKQQEVFNFVNRYCCQDGSCRWIEWRSIPVGDRIYSVARDITSRKLAEAAQKESEEKLRISLKEKEILLRELYHRTKNNIQVISSMLRLKAQSLDNELISGVFREIGNKIMSMALVHQKLYESQDLSCLNFKEYIEELLLLIKRSYSESFERIEMSFCGENINVLLDTAMPCGLIINELVTNAIKYAFPDNRKGNINITLQLSSQKELVLKISDNGVGLPKNFDVRKNSGLGIQTIVSSSSKCNC